jgi:hypothetical protein
VTEKNATADKPAGMGIQFLFKEEGERERVEEFVSKLMRSSLGDQLTNKLLPRR